MERNQKESLIADLLKTISDELIASTPTNRRGLIRKIGGVGITAAVLASQNLGLSDGCIENSSLDCGSVNECSGNHTCFIDNSCTKSNTCDNNGCTTNHCDDDNSCSTNECKTDTCTDNDTCAMHVKHLRHKHMHRRRLVHIQPLRHRH